MTKSPTQEYERFYKLNPEGFWYRKSECGSYERLEKLITRKRLPVLASKTMKRIE